MMIGLGADRDSILPGGYYVHWEKVPGMDCSQIGNGGAGLVPCLPEEDCCWKSTEKTWNHMGVTEKAAEVAPKIPSFVVGCFSPTAVGQAGLAAALCFPVWGIAALAVYFLWPSGGRR